MKTVLVTGVSSGLGKSLLEAFSSRGYRVLGVCRTESSGDDPNVQLFKADLSDSSQVSGLAENIPWTDVDILINNAGFSLSGAFSSLSQEEIVKINQVNYLTPLRLIRQFIGAKKSGGVIVNVSSITAMIPMPFNGAYSASKGALSTATEILRRELGESWTVLEVCPVTIATQFHQRMGSPSKASGGLHMAPHVLAEKIVNACERNREGVYYPGMLSKALGLLGTRFGFLLSRILFRK